jgi:hypothetical protein
VHLYIQSGFLIRLFCIFSSINKIELFFFNLQIVEATSPLNGLVFQISNQYNKNLDLMHLYFQSVYEEHQMGLMWTIIQFMKNVACIASSSCAVTQPSRRKGTCPLAQQSEFS